tara:strand:- start:316 stop:3432 length:3117 start_codon:yes stop_codon:yes gene_type:complete
MRDSSPPKWVVLLIVPVLAAGIWFLTQGTGPSKAGSGTEVLGIGPDDVRTSHPVADADPSNLVGLSLDDETTEARRADSLEDEPQAARIHAGSRLGLPTGVLWVRGMVNLPDGTPIDEKAVVVANGRRFKNFPNQPDRYEAEIEPDGTFKVAFAPDTTRGRLFIEGRYVYLPEPFVISPALTPTGTVLEPQLGGRIEVEVLPPLAAAFDDEALDGLVVSAAEGMFSYMGAETLKGVRLEDSRFEIGGAVPGNQYTVKARSPIYADGTAQGEDVEPGKTQYVQVALSTGVRLAGKLVDSQGDLVLGAKVLAMNREQAASRNPIFNRKVDDVDESGNGTFLLRGVPPSDEVMLVVEADGYLEKQMSLGELRDGDRMLNLNVIVSKGGILSGTVMWPDGEPAVGAEVRVSQSGDMRGWDLERVVGEAKTNEVGAFELSGLTEGECAISAACFEPGYEPPENATLRERKLNPPPLWRAHVEDVKPGQRDLNLTLSEGSNINGQVLDDSGEPVTNFQIVATPHSEGMMLSSSLKPVKERFKSKEGEFSLGGIMPGRWTVRARAVGYAEGKEVKVSAPSDQALAIELPRASSIRGVVRTPGGKLNGKARVNARHGDGQSSQADTQNGGEFTVSRINPGSVTITATAEGYASSDPVNLELGAGDEREEFILYLRNGGTLNVEVHPRNQPIEGRQITLSGNGWNRKTSDANGKAQFTGLEPGDYTVTMEPSGGSGGRRGRGGANWILRNANQIEADVTLENEQVETIVLGEPPASAVTVTGRVTSGGSPVSGALVTLSPIDSDDAQAATETGADGTYELVVDEPGEWRFLVGRQWGQQSSFRHTVPAATQFVLDFELPESKVTGVVRGPGGQLQNNVSLSLTKVEDGQEIETGWMGRRQTNTDSEGRYTFREVSPGTYNLRAAHGGRNNSDPLGQVLIANVDVSEDAETEKNVELPRAGIVRGLVTDMAGNPVDGARIQIRTLDGFRVTARDNETADSSGEYEIEELAPASLQVRARGENGWGEFVNVRVRSQSAVDINLRVPTGE